MRIKICGLTRTEDAQLAQQSGAWALGFIFYPLSKRHITPEAAKTVIQALAEPVLKIGVFVNQTDEALGIARHARLDGMQLHGDETPEDCLRVKKSFSGLIIKAFRPAAEKDLDVIKDYKGIVDYILLDAAVAGAYGGTGKTASWDYARKASAYGVPLILAGGLTADNIVAGAKGVRPFALDLSSGVESSPGVKDVSKLKSIFTVLQGEEE